MLSYVFLGCPEGKSGEICRVGSHISDQTSLIKCLSHSHCDAHGETEFASSLLLKCRRGERGCGISNGLFLLNAGDFEFSSNAVLKETTGVFDATELAVKQSFDFH